MGVVAFHLSVFSFKLLHFNQKCLPSKSRKTQLPKEIGGEILRTISTPGITFTLTSHRGNLFAKTPNTGSISLSLQSVSYPQTIFAFVELNLRLQLFSPIN